MRVLVVEDSKVIATYVQKLLQDAPNLHLLPIATTGREAIEMASRARPNVILMDLELPDIHGVDAIREIMHANPCPIVVLSGHLAHADRDRTFDSLQAGAVEVLAKPEGIGVDDVEAFRDRLLRTLEVMSTAKVVRRRQPPSHHYPSSVRQAPVRSHAVGSGIVVIGASTGGPRLVRDILKAIPTPYPFPIVVAQHIVPRFEASFARWLATTGHHVVVAEETVSMAACGVHVLRADCLTWIEAAAFRCGPCEDGRACPCIDLALSSAAETWGEATTGILLTGMGCDGARGLGNVRHVGGMTIAQDDASCVVASMPNHARAIGAVQRSLAPAGIARFLSELIAPPT